MTATEGSLSLPDLNRNIVTEETFQSEGFDN